MSNFQFFNSGVGLVVLGAGIFYFVENISPLRPVPIPPFREQPRIVPGCVLTVASGSLTDAKTPRS